MVEILLLLLLLLSLLGWSTDPQLALAATVGGTEDLVEVEEEVALKLGRVKLGGGAKAIGTVDEAAAGVAEDDLVELLLLVGAMIVVPIVDIVADLPV